MTDKAERQDVSSEPGESPDEAGGGAAEPASAPPPGDSSDADAEADIGAPTREGMQWYVLRVASNKEGPIRAALERKVKIEALEKSVGRILVPTVKEKRIKAGKAKVIEKKLYPGYVFVEMAADADGSIPEDVWFMAKETMGVGDFIGSEGKPTAMAQHDVDKLLEAAERAAAGEAGSAVPYTKGDRVKIREGSFENFEGVVDEINSQKGTVRVIVTIFGRLTPIEIEYWQVESL